MGLTLAAPPPMVLVPGRGEMPMFPARPRRLRPSRPPPAPFTLPSPPGPPGPSQKWRVTPPQASQAPKAPEPPRSPVILIPAKPLPEPPVPRWKIAFEPPEVEVPGRAEPMPLSVAPAPPAYTSIAYASYVALVSAPGTYVTSSPANLLIGPTAYITDFTIHVLDAGTF